MNYKKMLNLTQINLSANFEGENSKNKKMTQKKFELKGSNSTSSDVKLALFKGTYSSIEEIKKIYPEIDAIIVDGTCLTLNEGTQENPVNKTVVFNSKSKKSIAHMQEYAKRRIMQVSSLEMVSMDKRNFQEDIQYAETSPFNDARDFTGKRISDFVSPDQMDGNRAICRGINIPVNPASLVVITLRANSEIDLALTFDV
ncbi:hypothetical protein FACS1894153_0400 [Bacteroidia bacterium]|nr:hypothetical protein FACS1894153_0400 [Bacteroidia bacterium]